MQYPCVSICYSSIDFINKKRLLPFFVILGILGLFSTTQAQQVFTVKYPGQANVKLFDTPDSTIADLIVFVKSDTTGTSGNNGIWYETTDPTNAQKIFFTSDTTSSDMKIYITGNISNAGWINTAKMGLMH